jgi:soluble lytic murein transglycosylase
LAQQGGITVLRGESTDPQRPGVPNTGVRRVPSTSHPAPAPTNPTASHGGQLPIAEAIAGVRATTRRARWPGNRLGQAAQPGEAAAPGSAFSAIDEAAMAMPAPPSPTQ